MAKKLAIGFIMTVMSLTPVFAANIHPEQKAIFRAVNCDPNRCQPKIHKVIKGYACVIGICKLKNCENEVYYLKKTSKGWVLVETGTGIDPDDLEKDGFPPKIAEELTR
jgi:hypothetical protein